MPGSTDLAPSLLLQATGAFTASWTWWLMNAASILGMACAVAWLAGVGPPTRGDASSGRLSAMAPALGLFLGALAVRSILPTWTHYTYDDEYAYMRAASALQTTGVFSLSNQPPLLVYLYARAFGVLGTSAQTTYVVGTLAGSLAAPALYGSLRAFLVDGRVAFLAAGLLALHPLHIKHSGASSLEVVSVLFVIAAVGTFALWLRRPAGLTLATFGVCLFATLTTRIENFALLPILLGSFYVYRPAGRRITAVEATVLACFVLIAGLYLPGTLAFHGGPDDWWKSELSPGALLANNLSFWIGGRLETGKLPALLLLLGVLGSWRSDRAACGTWLALLLVYSAVYVLHGVNLGDHHESGHSPYFAARRGGHDMFRFNVPLLPAITFFTASGVFAAVGWLDQMLARWIGRRRRLATAMTASALVAVLLVPGREYRAYDPLAFLRSPYNRPVEIAEYRFLEAHLARQPRPLRCYTITAGTEPFLGDGIELVTLPEDRAPGLDTQSTYLYVASPRLRRPETARALARAAKRFRLEPVAEETFGSVEFRLFRIRDRRGAAGLQERAGGKVSQTAPIAGAPAASTRRRSASSIACTGGPQSATASGPCST